MTTLILIRHGESEGNHKDIYCGQMDFPLSELGHVQAEHTAAYLKENYKIDKIYSSDLSRAVQTAEPAAKRFGLEILTDPGLRERSVGVWSGLPVQTVEVEYADLMAAMRRGEDNAPEGGERNSVVRQRVLASIDRILAENRGKCIAVFTHWGGIHHIVRSWGRVKPELFHFEEGERYCNASVTVGLYDDDGVFQNVIALGYDAHLNEMITSNATHRY